MGDADCFRNTFKGLQNSGCAGRVEGEGAGRGGRWAEISLKGRKQLLQWEACDPEINCDLNWP